MSRILVVDDQKDVRAMIAMVLRLSHFDVVEADSVRAGLQAFEEGGLDAAVVDVFLQDVSGFELIAAMRERAPGLPVVVVSGLAKLDAVARSAAVSNVVCLQKPFRPAELVRALEAARNAMQHDAAAAWMAG